MGKAICTPSGKVIYKRHQDAAKALHRAHWSVDNLVQQPQSIYRCTHCRRWHLTSYTPEETRQLQHARRRRNA